jgi:7,8-dihydro-6-hydroxymethylpterin dimethyltransferase
MLILEIIDECDLSCPTCIAASTVGSGNARPRAQLIERIARLTSRVGTLPLIMVSGGEPTLHPEVMEILGDLRQYADQVMLITNGVRIAVDESFAASLTSLGPKFQVYLQFDSMNPEALMSLRGKDYTKIRRDALTNLQLHNVATTLICVVKRGLNDKEVGEIVRLASTFKNIVGVTFQPIRSSGRHADFSYQEHSISLSEVRRQLLIDLNFSEKDIIPHPVNPERIAIGYFTTAEGPLRSVTTTVFDEINLLKEQEKTPLYLNNDQIHEHGGGLPTLRVAIISYLDRFDFSQKFSRQGGIAFLTDDEKIVPLDQRFLFAPPANQPISLTYLRRVP